MSEPTRCSGCYDSFSGPWCDNCDSWPCDCTEEDAADGPETQESELNQRGDG